jgi:ribosomal subunit interface protein
VDIIFKGRHTDIPDRFRAQAAAKLGKIEKLEHKAIRVDVQLTAERNPRQAGRRERVELTVTSRGPAIRAEAAAEDRYAALDIAFGKLEARLRRASDRRKARHGAHAAVRLTDLPATAGDLTADLAAADGGEPATQRAGSGERTEVTVDYNAVAVQMQGDGPLVVREKFHQASPMTIDQALFEMELVGHDFFLFMDIHDGLPSVVYRRQGYQYGVLRLVEQAAASNGAGAQEPRAQRQRQVAAKPGAS